MLISRQCILISWTALLGCIGGCSPTLGETGSPTSGGSGSGGSGTSGGAGAGMTTSGAGGSSGASGGATGSGGSGGTSGGSGGGSGGTSGGAAGSSGGGSGGVTIMDASDGARDASADVSIQDSGPVGPPSDASPTTGCGNAAGQALSTYVVKNTMSDGAARSYSLYLPAGYAPTRAYPLVILGHGCSGAGATPFPIETASKADAIVVALKSVGDCFVYGATGADVVYFDTVLAEVSASHCVDRSRVFMAGFSSGSYLTYTIGCVRAGIVRGQGNAAGAQVNLPTCTGPIAAMMAHDTDDMDNPIAGGIAARDRILRDNGCTTQTVPYDFDGDPATPSTCVMYQGCRPGYPVVWCQTTGKGHSSQVPITTVGLWRFWSQL
jgi:polyhydroxybutyrate depolymerase